jgi:pilus assembly protein FimV
MDFDLESLSFDLATPDSQLPTDAKADADAMSRALPELTGDDGSDPLATKLALAEEFNAIGDPDGARSLAQEVLAEASGDLRQRAQRLLADIG